MSAKLKVGTALVVVLALALGFVNLGGRAKAAEPTCSTTLGIVVHGQHIVGDYVTGIGHADLGWPPSGGVVGEAVSANGGAAIPGGPGPGFHFPNGFAPGASFCLLQSLAPGTHLGP
ncbi:MAG TPA: hypothetical protein VLS25_07890 [Dehalococcoidia bacterium]|nr:hypothetical protein [Dehalococcoidia bacterium]